MIDHLKNSKKVAIQALANHPNTLDLQLVDIQNVALNIDIVKKSIAAGGIDQSQTFANIFGLDTNFFYVIEQVKDNKVVNYERGIGSVYQQDNDFFLKRKISFVIGNNAGESYNNPTNTPLFLRCENNVMIYSSVPPTYFECMSVPHAVLTSHDVCLPQPVVLPENSILGRLNGNIQSVSFDDVGFIENIIHSISQFTKQIKLKTSKLISKRSQVEILDLEPISNPHAKEGSMYYDKYSRTVKLYDGQNWRTLAFVKDDDLR